MTEIDNIETAPEAAEPAAPKWGEDHATFGDRLAAAREALGLSPEQLAWRLGVRRSTIAAWEDDRAEPRSNRMQMLAGILNVSLVWLMTGEGEGPGGAAPPQAEELIQELALLKSEQERLAARFARFESRLRAALAA